MPLVVRSTFGLRSAPRPVAPSRSTHGPAQLTITEARTDCTWPESRSRTFTPPTPRRPCTHPSPSPPLPAHVAHVPALPPAPAVHELLRLAVVEGARPVARGGERVLQAEPLRIEQQV